jgi:hypothetical protein
MANAQNASREIAEFLAGRVSLEKFEDWSASFVREAYRNGDTEEQRVAVRIRSILNAFADDDSEDGLRGELEAITFVPEALITVR